MSRIQADFLKLPSVLDLHEFSMQVPVTRGMPDYRTILVSSHDPGFTAKIIAFFSLIYEKCRSFFVWIWRSPQEEKPQVVSPFPPELRSALLQAKKKSPPLPVEPLKARAFKILSHVAFNLPIPLMLSLATKSTQHLVDYAANLTMNGMAHVIQKIADHYFPHHRPIRNQVGSLVIASSSIWTISRLLGRNVSYFYFLGIAFRSWMIFNNFMLQAEKQKYQQLMHNLRHLK